MGKTEQLLSFKGFISVLISTIFIEKSGIVLVIKKIEQQTSYDSVYIFKKIVSISVFKRH